MHLNKVSLIGNLADNPVRALLPDRTLRTRFHLAVTYVWPDAKARERRQSTERFTIEARGKLAEIIAAYLREGSKVYVEGKLIAGGSARRDYVFAENVIMLGHRSPEGG